MKSFCLSKSIRCNCSQNMFKCSRNSVWAGCRVFKARVREMRRSSPWPWSSESQTLFVLPSVGTSARARVSGCRPCLVGRHFIVLHLIKVDLDQICVIIGNLWYSRTKKGPVAVGESKVVVFCYSALRNSAVRNYRRVTVQPIALVLTIQTAKRDPKIKRKESERIIIFFLFIFVIILITLYWFPTPEPCIR